jgi:predicted RNase H-like HicB family nuclease
MSQDMIRQFTVLFEPIAEGGYNVIVPSIPEICTFGSTYEEAKAMVADAIRCYLESALELGEEIPSDVHLTHEPHKECVAVELATP